MYQSKIRMIGQGRSPQPTASGLSSNLGPGARCRLEELYDPSPGVAGSSLIYTECSIQMSL
jgi:gamma-glutamylcysteine synthetase